MLWVDDGGEGGVLESPGGSGWRVRAAEASDVEAIVDVHMSSFQGFFLTFLGRRFLRELYSALVADSNGIAFVSDGDGITGFVAGTTCPEGLYGRLVRQRWWRFALAAAGAVCRRPGVVPRLVRALTKPRERPATAGAALLMSIAVRPEQQGSGAGRLLVRRFLAEAERRGASTVTLTTDRDGNERVNAFYQSLGFGLSRTFVTPEGRRMNEFSLPVRPQPS